MHVLVSNLVAASLLLHAVFGCCWHHRHDTSCCDNSPVAQAVEACCQHHRGDECNDKHSLPSPAPCQGGPHCLGDCNYLAVQKSHLDQVQFDVPLDFAIPNSPFFDVRFATAHGCDRLYELDTGPPLRLHLVHQILLI